MDGSYKPLKTNGYDQYGRVIWERDGNNRTTSYSYDNWSRGIKTTYPDGAYSTVAYDDLNRQITATDEEGNQKRTTMDAWGQVILTEEKKGTGFIQTGSIVYDSLGQVITSKDSANATNYEYDLLGRMKAVTDALGNRYEYSYTMSGQMKQMTYPDGQRVTKQYNELGQLIKQTNELGATDTYDYDANGNIIQHVDRKGQSFTYTYNNRNRLIKLAAPGESVIYQYDLAGRRLSMTDKTGITQYQYHTNTKQLIKLIYPDGKSISYVNNVMGQRQSMVDPFGYTTVYTYDTRNRLKGVGSTASSLDASYEYDKSSRLKTITLGNTNRSEYVYDGIQLGSLTHKKNDGTVLHRYQYEYDGNANISTQSGVQGNEVFYYRYAYDPLNRIQSSSQFEEQYAYDARGNRVSYMTTKQNPVMENSDYEYDAFNRLVKATTATGKQISYVYNGDGMLYERKEGAGKTRYYNDGADIIAEGTVTINGTATLKARYVRGKGLVARQDGTRKAYYMHNGHGDVIELRDNTGNLSLNNYSYDIWGKPLTAAETIANPFRYSGEYWDNTTELQYLRSRWYNPTDGRFISKDTYEGDIKNPLMLNLYAYVHNNPLIYTDPTGHCVAGKDAGCYVDSFSNVDYLISNPQLFNNSDLWRQYQKLKENCDTSSCISIVSAKQKVLEKANDEIRNSACVYVDCFEGQASFSGFSNGYAQITQDTKNGKATYTVTSLGLMQCNCFSAETTVLTKNGEKAIEDIKVGDEVLSKNEETGDIKYKKVLGLFQKKADEIYKVYIGDEVIEATGEHPFWLDGKGWTLVKDLEVGDLLLSNEGKRLEIHKIEKERQDTTVYNFEVEDYHSYFVSNLGVWVHNCQVTEQMVRDALKGADLKAQQTAISLPVVQRYVDMLLKGSPAPSVKVDDGILVDGYHRYVAGLVVGRLPTYQPWMGGRPSLVIPWDKLKIDPKDWGNK